MILALAIVGHQGIARACSCIVDDSPPSTWRGSAPVIFLAQVLDVQGSYMIPEGERSIRFENDRFFRMRRIVTWEGEVADTVVVRTGSGGGDCGYAFALGGLYMVYASGAGDTLRTGICTRTQAWTSAHEDSLALGPPKLDGSAERGWAAFAPPISCPVHAGSPVRLATSVVVYGMPAAVEQRYWREVERSFPRAALQLAPARADSARTGTTPAYVCPVCQKQATEWCEHEPHFLIQAGRPRVQTLH